MEIEDWLGKDNTIGIDIWKKKYQHNNETFEQWLNRVSGNDEEVKQLIREKKFLFGGRILANRGLDKEGVKVTYSNCYVLPAPEDNIESIFDCAKQMARTFSYGGGVGVDISKLAPRGAKINNTADETSGAVSFTDLFSMVTGLIGQHGRRGALMLSMSCDHPDLIEFINAKTDVNRITKANMSVRVSNKFMNAVDNNQMYTQSFERPETHWAINKEIDAREVFKTLCNNNYEYGEPGCLFWDRIKSWNLLSHYPNFEYAGVNPCAEEPLPAGGSCLLGSINLSAFVGDNNSKGFDLVGFDRAVHIAVRALNDVLDEGLALHPLDIQQKSVADWRQIGLGIMGLADCFIKLGISYGDLESISLSKLIGNHMINSAVESSAIIAKEKGSFKMYDYNNLKRSSFYIDNICSKVATIVANYGLRNSQLLTIAPTGTLSTMLGVSGGIEPLFATHFDRTTKSLGEKEKVYKIYPKIVKDYMGEHNLTDDSQLPSIFVTAQSLEYKERIWMQSTWQNYIDASISSTINLPQDFPKDKIYDIYVCAWKFGCKGITIFRDGCRRDSILTTKEKEKVEQSMNVHKESIGQLASIKSEELFSEKSMKFIVQKGINTNELVGKQRTLVTGCGNLHVLAYFDKAGNLKEVYLNKGSTGGCHCFMNGLSRMISLACKNGVPLDDIIDQLNSCGACPSYAVRSATKHDTSKGSCCPMAVGNALKEMNEESTFVCCPKSTKEEIDRLNKGKGIIDKEDNSAIIVPDNSSDLCPECGMKLTFSGGCNSCPNCGYSKCS